MSFGSSFPHEIHGTKSSAYSVLLIPLHRTNCSLHVLPTTCCCQHYVVIATCFFSTQLMHCFSQHLAVNCTVIHQNPRVLTIPGKNRLRSSKFLRCWSATGHRARRRGWEEHTAYALWTRGLGSAHAYITVRCLPDSIKDCLYSSMVCHNSH